MPEIIESPSRVQAAGTKPKLIDEFVGRVNTGDERLSVARMQSPEGWVEPGQRPERADVPPQAGVEAGRDGRDRGRGSGAWLCAHGASFGRPGRLPQSASRWTVSGENAGRQIAT